MTADDARAGSGPDRGNSPWRPLALAVVVATAAFPMIVDARGPGEIPVEQQAGAGDPRSRPGRGESVETVSVPLSSLARRCRAAPKPRSSPPASRPRERTSGFTSECRGATGRRTRRPIRCANSPMPPRSSLPVSSEERPPIAMGSTDNRVNVWYWNGADGTESLRRRRRQHDTDPGVDGGDERDTHRRPMDRRSAGRSRQTART